MKDSEIFYKLKDKIDITLLNPSIENNETNSTSKYSQELKKKNQIEDSKIKSNNFKKINETKNEISMRSQTIIKNSNLNVNLNKRSFFDFNNSETQNDLLNVPPITQINRLNFIEPNPQQIEINQINHLRSPQMMQYIPVHPSMINYQILLNQLLSDLSLTMYYSDPNALKFYIMSLIQKYKS